MLPRIRPGMMAAVDVARGAGQVVGDPDEMATARRRGRTAGRGFRTPVPAAHHRRRRGLPADGGAPGLRGEAPVRRLLLPAGPAVAVRVRRLVRAGRARLDL